MNPYDYRRVCLTDFEKRVLAEETKQSQDRHEIFWEGIERHRKSGWWQRRFSHAQRLSAKISLVVDYNAELRNEDPYEDYR